MKELVLSKHPNAFCKKKGKGYMVRINEGARYVSFEETPLKAWAKAALLLNLT